MKQELTEQQKQILKLALQGYNYPEITQQLNIYGEIVEYFITQLRNPASRYYNPDLYKKIKMEQYLRKYGTIDFDKIEEIQLLLTQGYCLFEIALYYQTTEENLKKRLYALKKHSYITENTYNLIKEKDKKIQKNSWFDIFTILELIEKEGYDFKEHYHTGIYNRYVRYKTYRSIIWEFAINRKTEEEIAIQFHYTKDSVKNILKNKEHLKLFPVEEQDIIQQEILARQIEISIEKKQGQKRINEALYGPKTTHINMKLYQIEVNKDYYFKLITTFRLTIEDFSKMIGIDFLQKELYYHLLKMMGSEVRRNALHYVFECYSIYYPDTDERRLKEAKAFDKRLKLAQLMNDQTTAKELLDYLNDAKYTAVFQKRIFQKKLTAEEWEIVFQYRFKYAIPYRKMNIDTRIIKKYLPSKYRHENEILNNFLKEAGFYRRNYSENLTRKQIRTYYQ